MSGDRQDAMIARLETDVEERNAFVQGLIAAAQDDNRSLTENERQLITNAEKIVQDANEQLELLYRSRTTTTKARERARELQSELSRMRQQVDTGPVEYRTAGAYALDSYKAHLGDREARERMEVFLRAAAHQKTSDNLGIVPDPILGGVVNFIDATRPIVAFTGVQPMTAATWYRPKVTVHTSVAPQGAAGGSADEKAELVSQKMTIVRLTANAVTLGGYVNVSRQNIDFSTPQALDAVVNDLAAQYAIQTEASAAASINTGGTTSVLGAAATSAEVAAALWLAASNVYTAVKGQGRLFLAIAPSRLKQFGPLFAPVNPQNSQSPGLEAGAFGQGLMGTISGIPVLMSAGLPTDAAVVASTAATEFYEQRVGTLQVTEPSVLGVQVAYAGYFTPMTIENNGKHRFTLV